MMLLTFFLLVRLLGVRYVGFADVFVLLVHRGFGRVLIASLTGGATAGLIAAGFGQIQHRAGTVRGVWRGCC